MSNPKEKAIELVDRFTFTCREWDCEDNAKKCALIAVDTIIFELKLRNCSVKYFEEVKQEIELL